MKTILSVIASIFCIATLITYLHLSFGDSRSRKKFPEWWDKYEKYKIIYEKWKRELKKEENLKNDIDNQLENCKYLPKELTDIIETKQLAYLRKTLIETKIKQKELYAELNKIALELKDEQNEKKIFCSEEIYLW
jgi:hypothetical protein